MPRIQSWEILAWGDQAKASWMLSEGLAVEVAATLIIIKT
jgi:hypothetical protein